MMLRSEMIKNLPGNAWWLVLAVPLLLPFSNSYTYMTGIFAIGGVVVALRHRDMIWSFDATRCLVLLFLSLWLPMLLAVPDAAAFNHSLKSTLGYLHFLPATLFMIWLMRDDEGGRRVQIGLTLLLAIWSFDAVFQYIAGYNLLGYPYGEKRVTGIFYPRKTLGIVLAAFAPIYLITIYTYIRNRGTAWLLAPLLITAILLSGSRASWLMLGIALVYAAWRMRDAIKQMSGRVFNVRILLIIVLVVAAVASSPYHVKRFNLDSLQSGMHPRVELWGLAYVIWKDHWLNGVGVRGYRYVVPEYTPPDGRLVSITSGLGRTHPHLMLAEIAAETGVIGIAGFVLFWWVLFLFMRRLSKDTLWRVMPCVVTLIIIMLPLNAHKAFYSTFYSTILWWMIAVLLAATLSHKKSSGTDIERNT